MNLFLLALLSFLLGGSGNDLLDYVPTDLYWKAKQVQVSVRTLSAELAAPTDADISRWLAELDAPDAPVRTLAYQRLLHAGPVVVERLGRLTESQSPEAKRRAAILLAKIDGAPRRHAVRRLMAIRTLGELQNPSAVPLLQPLLKSDELFVADYAAEALARIEKKPYARARSNSDLEASLLPASYRAVVHLNLRSGGPLNYDKAFEQLPLGPDQDKAVTIDFIAGKALRLAETIGNVRIDAITAGASGDPDDTHGSVAFIFSGLFDAEALHEFARQQKIVFQTINGARVYRTDPETHIFWPSNRRLAMVVSKQGNPAAVTEIIASEKAAGEAPEMNTEMARLLQSIDRAAPVWGGVRVTEAYRQIPMLHPFDSITLQGVRRASGIELTLRAEGSDAGAVGQSAERLVAQIHSVTAAARRAQPVMPSLSIIVDAMSSIIVKTEGSIVSAKVIVKQSPADSFLLPLLMTYGVPSNHAEAMPPD